MALDVWSACEISVVMHNLSDLLGFVPKYF